MNPDYSAYPGRLDIVFPATSHAAAKARRALKQLGLPDDMLADAQLLVTELVTNSVKYAGLTKDDSIRVVASWTGYKLRVGIHDRSAGPDPPVVVGAIRPSPKAGSGWGLYFVDQLSVRWGYDAGKGYWFELELPRD